MHKIKRKRCEVLVIALLGKKLAEKWWESPNKAFDQRTPEEQWQLDPESVYDYLMFYASK